MKMLLLCAAAVLGVATVPTPTLNPHLQRAMVQIDQLQESDALRSLELAHAWPHNTPQDAALVHLYTGLAHAGLADEARAVASFRTALKLEPKLQLPGEQAPRVHQWWRLAGGEEPRSTGSLQEPTRDEPVTSTPAPPAAVPAPSPAWAASAKQPSQPPSKVAAMRWIAGGALAAGALAAAGGAYLGARAQAQASLANSELHITSAKAAYTAAENQSTGSTILFAVGGALAAGGAIVFIVSF